ncbi:hypothetical protein GCM10009676_25440 [Prauserella halophila]|uniref:Uncharacterized protein n=1 Tax=Prauserella halophila TaxID=185641 RepID=A0ABN1W844_9PSEU
MLISVSRGDHDFNPPTNDVCDRRIPAALLARLRQANTERGSDATVHTGSGTSPVPSIARRTCRGPTGAGVDARARARVEEAWNRLDARRDRGGSRVGSAVPDRGLTGADDRETAASALPPSSDDTARGCDDHVPRTAHTG